MMQMLRFSWPAKSGATCVDVLDSVFLFEHYAPDGTFLKRLGACAGLVDVLGAWPNSMFVFQDRIGAKLVGIPLSISG